METPEEVQAGRLHYKDCSGGGSGQGELSWQFLLFYFSTYNECVTNIALLLGLTTLRCPSHEEIVDKQV